MHSIFNGLIDACDRYDFGLFILTPDDKLESRGIKGMSARDNVLFELGLFLGKLGANRTVAVIQDVRSRRKKVKIPSDLAGIYIPHFEQDESNKLFVSVTRAANDIKPIIEREGRRHGHIKIVKSWGFNRAEMTFSMRLSGVLLENNKDKLRNKSLILVTRKHNEEIDFEHDSRIAIGRPRKLSRFSRDELVLHASGRRIFADIRNGDRVDGCLLLSPYSVSPKDVKTIAQMIELGFEILEFKGVKVKGQ
jgi:hypothetical protein